MTTFSRRQLLKGAGMAGLAAAAGPIILPRAARAATELRYAHVQPAAHITNRSAEWLGEEIAKATGGEFTMRVYPGGQLGGPDEMLDSLAAGDLDFAWIASPSLGTSIPEMNIFSLSYLFRDFPHFQRAMAQDGPVMGWLRGVVDDSPYDVGLVGMLGGVPRNLYNNIRPVREPADLEGIKLRVQSSPLEARTWAELGALPQQLAWTEIYTGLQTGVVNGAESSIDAYLSNRFNEVAPHLSLTRHQFLVMPLLMSKATMKRIGDKNIDAVLAAAYQSGLRCQEVYNESEDAVIAEARKLGATVTEADTGAFQEKLADLIRSEARRYEAEDLIEKIRSA